MSLLELKKIKLELMKVSTAKLELECRVDDFKESIARLEESIAVQKTKEEELIVKIKEMEGKI